MRRLKGQMGLHEMVKRPILTWMIWGYPDFRTCSCKKNIGHISMRYTWWYDMIWYGDPTNTLCVVNTFYGDKCYTYFVVFFGNVASYFFSEHWDDGIHCGSKSGSMLVFWQAPCWYQWYTGWWFQRFFLFSISYMGYIILPIDYSNIFQDGFSTTTQMISLVEVFAIRRTHTMKSAGKAPQEANGKPNLGDFFGRNMWIQLLFADGSCSGSHWKPIFFRREFLFIPFYSW